MSETADELVNAHNRDELNELAVEAGVENPESLGSKAEVAQAIVDANQSDPGASDEASTEVLGGRNEIPGNIFPDETLEDVRERTFERDFGHLEGDELERARAVQEANWRLEDETNALPGYVGG